MCVSIVARVVHVDLRAGTAQVEVDGATRTVGLLPLTASGVPVERGMDVLVHTGFATAVLDAEDANALRALRREVV